MGYFRELPDLQYRSFAPDKTSSSDYILVKNFFRRVKLRDDLHNITTIFIKYQIEEGMRPDLVAEELYGSPDLDWVVLLSSGTINVRDEWPLSDRDLYKYAEELYGEDLNRVRFYETREVKDSEGRLILPKGKVVNSNFQITNPDNKKQILNPVSGVSNYEYEVRKNNKKRSIYLLKPDYLQQFLNDMRTIMHYTDSSEYVSDTLIKSLADVYIP
jgi:hypothetical protein